MQLIKSSYIIITRLTMYMYYVRIYVATYTFLAMSHEFFYTMHMMALDGHKLHQKNNKVPIARFHPHSVSQ